jgi:hypothetical protein
VQSEWVRSEASEGKRRGILVPVLLDAVDAPLAFRLLNGADLSSWEPGTPHPELDRLAARITEILGQEGRVAPAPVRDYSGGQPPVPWFRQPRVVGFSILLVAGVICAAYVAGTGYRLASPPSRDSTSSSQPWKSRTCVTGGMAGSGRAWVAKKRCPS